MGGIPSFFRGVGAAFQSAQIENDANFRVGRETRRIAAETAVRALEILPDMGPELEARGIPLAGRSVADVVPKRSEGGCYGLRTRPRRR